MQLTGQLREDAVDERKLRRGLFFSRRALESFQSSTNREYTNLCEAEAHPQTFFIESTHPSF